MIAEEVADVRITLCCLAGIYLLVFLYSILNIPRDAIFSRAISVAGLVLCAVQLQALSYKMTSSPLHRSTISSFIWIDCLNLFELIIVSRATHQDIQPANKNDATASLSATIRTPFKFVANWRRVGTKWQVRQTFFSGTPSRSRFIVEGTLWFVICYLILDLMMQSPAPASYLYDAEKETILNLSSLSKDDWSFRILTAISFWLMQYFWISKMITLAGVCTVMAGIHQPKDWPRLNGPLSTAFTVRNFWGQFWHQCMRQSLTGVSNAIGKNVLQLKSPLVSRYIRLFIAFAFSGAVHQAINHAMGIRGDGFSALKFFLLQPIGIMFEDAVQELTTRWEIRQSLKKVIGYIWVLLFMCLVTPVWSYPQLRLGEDYSIVPFPIVERLLY